MSSYLFDEVPKQSFACPVKLVPIYQEPESTEESGDLANLEPGKILEVVLHVARPAAWEAEASLTCLTA